MSSFESTELRWFHRGVLSEGLAATFKKSSSELEVDERVDTYVCTTDLTLGVKLRDGGLEVKTRRRRPDVEIGSFSGEVELWTKWTWKGADSPFTNVKKVPPPWTTVQKRRLQWKFEWTSNGIHVVGDKRVERGGAFELTALEIQGQPWWTVALEAFEHSADGIEMLKCGYSELVSRFGSGVVGGEAMVCGYPEWLNSQN